MRYELGESSTLRCRSALSTPRRWENTIGERVTVVVERPPFERRFKRAEEGKTGENSPCVEGKEVPVSLHLRGGLVGRVGNLAFCNIRLLDASKSTSPSHSRIRQQRWPGSHTREYLNAYGVPPLSPLQGDSKHVLNSIYPLGFASLALHCLQSYVDSLQTAAESQLSLWVVVQRLSLLSWLRTRLSRIWQGRRIWR